MSGISITREGYKEVAKKGFGRQRVEGTMKDYMGDYQ
jgi:hypothetical protein